MNSSVGLKQLRKFISDHFFCDCYIYIINYFHIQIFNGKLPIILKIRLNLNEVNNEHGNLIYNKILA